MGPDPRVERTLDDACWWECCVNRSSGNDYDPILSDLAMLDFEDGSRVVTKHQRLDFPSGAYAVKLGSRRAKAVGGVSPATADTPDRVQGLLERHAAWQQYCHLMREVLDCPCLATGEWRVADIQETYRRHKSQLQAMGLGLFFCSLAESQDLFLQHRVQKLLPSDAVGHYKVVSRDEVIVRMGLESKTRIVQRLKPCTVFRVFDIRTNCDGHLRLRTSNGWCSLRSYCEVLVVEVAASEVPLVLAEDGEDKCVNGVSHLSPSTDELLYRCPRHYVTQRRLLGHVDTPMELRLDPANSCAWTFDELAELYEDTKAEAEIPEYWDQVCLPIDECTQLVRSATALSPRAVPPPSQVDGLDESAYKHVEYVKWLVLGDLIHIQDKYYVPEHALTETSGTEVPRQISFTQKVEFHEPRSPCQKQDSGEEDLCVIT